MAWSTKSSRKYKRLSAQINKLSQNEFSDLTRQLTLLKANGNNVMAMLGRQSLYRHFCFSADCRLLGQMPNKPAPAGHQTYLLLVQAEIRQNPRLFFVVPKHTLLPIYLSSRRRVSYFVPRFGVGLLSWAFHGLIGDLLLVPQLLFYPPSFPSNFTIPYIIS